MYRITSGVFAVLFVLGAAVQFNDPDPVAWILIYTASAAVAAVVAGGVRAARFPAVAIACVALVWGGLLAFGVLSEGQYLFDEEGRESMGLLIIACWNVGVVMWGTRR